MAQDFVPPFDSNMENPEPPKVYALDRITWEYKLISKNLDLESVLDEAELNALGSQGWELVTCLMVGSAANFYFRRSLG